MVYIHHPKMAVFPENGERITEVMQLIQNPRQTSWKQLRGPELPE